MTLMKNTFFSLSLGALLSACSNNTPTQIAEKQSPQLSENVVSMNLTDILEGLKSSKFSSEELIEAYLYRIETLDQNGPQLQSVISINPNAIEEAREIDRKRTAGEDLGWLAGIPILVKDNIETSELPTTAGSLALMSNQTGRDAPLIDNLKSHGAIVLGKTNLSEWANFRSQNSVSGWSAVGGQVRNAHILDRSPCGSSSGSGVAMSASLSAAAIGTETNGSIICPSNVSGIVGFKPTVGLISQKHIVPISETQDTAGPMMKTVSGAAIMFDAMASNGSEYESYKQLSSDSLQGKRIGVLRFAVGSNENIKATFNKALEALENEGATLVEIENFETPSDFWQNALTVLEYEFKDGINHYLSTLTNDINIKNLEDLIEFNKNNPRELSVFDQSIFDNALKRGNLTDDTYTTALKKVLKTTREDGIDMLMKKHNVDVLVSPSGPLSSHVDVINGDVWPAWAGAGWMAAISGYPHLTVPMGTVKGIPIGLSFFGAKNQDADVLSYGYDYEQATHLRVDPQFHQTARQIPELEKATQNLNHLK